MKKLSLTSVTVCFLFSIIFITAGCAKKAPVAPVPTPEGRKAEEMKSHVFAPHWATKEVPAAEPADEEGAVPRHYSEWAPEVTEEPKEEPEEVVEREVIKEQPAKEFKEMVVASVPPMKFEPSPDLGTIHFDFDKYNIKPEERKILNDNAIWLKVNAHVKVKIEGHCDERGTSEYNLALGDKRASSTKNYLASLGIDPARISTITYGEESPLCTEQEESCWSQNRRAEFLITK